MKEKSVADTYFSNFYDPSSCHKGLHMCSFSEEQEELKKGGLDFICHGIKKHHKIIYITNNYQKKEIIKTLHCGNPPIDEKIITKHLYIFSAKEAYFHKDRFSPLKVIDFWGEQVNIALRQGFPVVQALVNMDWIAGEFKELDEVIQYEALITEKLGGDPKLIFLCQYNMQLLLPGFVNKAIESHPLCQIENEIYANQYYIEPREYLSQEKEKKFLFQRLHQLKERRKKEDELTNLYAQTTDLKNFTHMVAHDLKEPIRNAYMLNEILLSQYQEELTPSTKDLIERISSSLHEGYHRIESLKALNLQSKNKNKKWIDLNELFIKTLNKWKEKVREVSGEIFYNPSSLGRIKIDEVHFSQLLSNIISNSIKYRKREVPLQIHVSAEQKPSQEVEIKISDNGIGFNAQFNGDVFHPFRRLHSSPGYEGTGIGLTICQRIMQDYEGEIHAEGEESIGTTIILKFPQEHSKEPGVGTVKNAA